MAANAVSPATVIASLAPYPMALHDDQFDTDTVDFFVQPRASPSPSIPRHLRCGYRSKICMKFRALKRNGSLHRFCEHHRQQANANQKRWASRKLQERTMDTDSGGLGHDELQQLERAYYSVFDERFVSASEKYVCSMPTMSSRVAATGTSDMSSECAFSPGGYSDFSACVDVDALWDSLILIDFTGELELLGSVTECAQEH